MEKGVGKKISKKPDQGICALILAAGKGTRMKSDRAKVLHEIVGKPLVSFPITAAQRLGADPVVVVVGHQKEAVSEAALACSPPARKSTSKEAPKSTTGIVTALQEEQRGTGHAVAIAMKKAPKFSGTVLILYGDVPLLQDKTLKRLLQPSQKQGRMCFLSAHLSDPTGYGRVVRNSDGHVQKIVEHKDASPDELKVTEVNAGIYAVPAEFLRKALKKLDSNNAQNEMYLTDIVEMAAKAIGVDTLIVDPAEVAGVNDRAQLAEVGEVMRQRLVHTQLQHATFDDPRTVVLGPDVKLSKDVVVGRNVRIMGNVKIGPGTTIADGAVITDSVIGSNVEIRPYCVITDTRIDKDCKIGPFAHLRPDSKISAGAHVGNFVETKKTTLGTGAKANHLTYLGDCDVGAGVNVGAGTITCNYNGYEKTRTTIAPGAFIGSDTQLVAPVKVGRNAVVAAGTTVTQEVPAGSLAISRAPQKNIPGYTAKLKKRYGKK